VSNLLVDIAQASHRVLLTQASPIDLRSNVAGKAYLAFRSGDRLSRPINKALFVFDENELLRRLAAFMNDRAAHLASADGPSTLYTIAMSYCAASDTVRLLDKKTPATYFEIFAGHLLADRFGANPQTSATVLNLDMKGDLPTDFIFDLGAGRSKFHVPIKISTRERVIQVWAHQRVLDGIYGAGRFRGLLVALTETKLDRKKLDVVEICLPDQWRVYQMFIAQLDRIYYLDPPAAYARLATGYPIVNVRPFSSFFSEADLLSGPS